MMNLVYHGTSFEGLVGICRTNTLASFDCNGPMGASLTASLEVAKRFALAKSAERSLDVGFNINSGADIDIYQISESLQWTLFGSDGGGGAILAFNQDKLSDLYPLVNFDELGDGSEFELRLLGENLQGIIAAVEGISVIFPEKYLLYSEKLVEYDLSYEGSISTIKELLNNEVFTQKNNCGVRGRRIGV